MSKLEGKIALITGGNSGIGLATAKRFVDEGAYVFINGCREVESLSAAKDIGKNVKALNAFEQAIAESARSRTRR
jgi:NAD(P)-dependent dehydrogenase (short-subunit alcohol dehydrogenase family)